MTRAALLLALSVSACASGQGAPIAYGQTPGALEASGEAPSRQDVGGPVDWADGEDTALSAYAMQPTGNDPRHPPRTHRVGANESLYDIATRYQIPLRALIEQNQLEPPFDLAPGRAIELPPPRLHRVAEGESFEDVARAYSMDVRSLALLNRMTPPYAVRAGDDIVLPALARVWAMESGSPALPPVIVAAAGAQPAVQSGPSRFAWPVRGDIVSSFGVQPGGRRIDGIEIAAAEGAPIRAAQEGDVVYAGADLPGYGALVLVRHADGYVTAYGYARRALVREGQHVRGGETLAEVGRAASGEPRLLFQVRRGAQAVDPAPLLGLTP